MGVEFALASPRAPELGYTAILHPDVGDLTVARSNNGPAADDELKTRNHHLSIVARRQCATAPIGRDMHLTAPRRTDGPRTPG